jgi:hypothetical protein
MRKPAQGGLFITGGEGGINSVLPCTSPSQARVASRVQTGYPAGLSNPSASHRVLNHTDLCGKNEKARARRAFSFSGGGCSLLRTRLCLFSLLWREDTGKIMLFGYGLSICITSEPQDHSHSIAFESDQEETEQGNIRE